MKKSRINGVVLGLCFVLGSVSVFSGELEEGLSLGKGVAKVQLASVFTDHMVLQRGKPVPVWGTANPHEKLWVEFAEQRKQAVADAGGEWRITLSPLTLSKTPQDLSVTSQNSDFELRVSDILVGDVWLCSGQSNMKWGLGATLESREIIQSADHPNLRLLQVPKNIQGQPKNEFNARWRASSPKAVRKFSAVGYIFGQRIQQETGVPIGLVMCATGSTSVECWVSNETLKTELFAPAIAKWREVEATWDDPAVRAKYIHKKVKDPDRIHPSDARTYPGGCYNGMLHPLFPFAIKGVVWYQGEANRARGQQYRELFPAMIQDWRKGFEQDDFKFYAVQLPEIGKPSPQRGDSLVAELREAQQLSAEKDPRLEMAVIIDSDQEGNIHPKNKQLPGERLALIALAKDYGKAVEYSGPVFQRLKVDGSTIHLSFTHVGEGLLCGKRKAATSLEVNPAGHALAHFIVAGADRVLHAAQATIEGDQVVVSCAAVTTPVAVRYAWDDNPVGCNFYNAAGLPAAPFRSDDWPMLSAGKVEGNVLAIR